MQCAIKRKTRIIGQGGLVKEIKYMVLRCYTTKISTFEKCFGNRDSMLWPEICCNR